VPFGNHRDLVAAGRASKCEQSQIGDVNSELCHTPGVVPLRMQRAETIFENNKDISRVECDEPHTAVADNDYHFLCY
jgi:hypothetical protein